MPPVIRTSRLARSFGTKTGRVEAVRGIDLTVERGEILGFLGPNGAGKTTTLRMLTTLLPPTGGTATVAGHPLAEDPAGVRRSIGYVAQSGGVDPQITVREELTTQGRLYRLPRAQAAARTVELAEQLGLAGLLDRRCAALSGGQRRRLDIAMALTHRPGLLFLDEPTTGLDPGSRADVWDLIRRLRTEQGMTVFLTTHYLDEADALADRLVVVDKGRIVLAMSLASLSYALAMVVSSPQSFAPVINAVNLPAMLLSGILLPMSLAPGWLDLVSRFVPFRYLVDGVRAAFLGDYSSGAVVLGAGVAALLAAVSMTLGARLFSRAGA